MKCGTPCLSRTAITLRVLDEEYECDRYARTFLLEGIPEYCLSTQDDQEAVLNKRMMGIVLGAFI
jgi:hypothetical protein